MRLFVAGTLFWALSPHDYGYYVFLRWITSGAAVLTSIQLHRANHAGPAFGFAGLAVLFNPIFPIYLSRSTWSVLDIGTALAFAWSAGTLGVRKQEG